MADWKNRIVGYGTESPEELAKKFNAKNWRLHPENQSDALDQALDKIGIIDDVIVNKTTDKLVDGHLRVTRALAKGVNELPVKYVELTEAEEDFALATFDPLSALAETDEAALRALADEVGENDLAWLIKAEGLEPFDPDSIEFKEYDESIADEVEYIECPHCGEKFPK